MRPNLWSIQHGRWSSEECERFEEGLRAYGKNWKKIARHVRTRVPSQVRSHAQKYMDKLKRQGLTIESVLSEEAPAKSAQEKDGPADACAALLASPDSSTKLPLFDLFAEPTFPPWFTPWYFHSLPSLTFPFGFGQLPSLELATALTESLFPKTSQVREKSSSSRHLR